MKFKRFISLLASMAMTVTALAGAISVSAADVVDTGKCGDLTWTLDSDGVLTLSGEGAMASPNVEDYYAGGLEKYLNSQLKDYTNIYTYKDYAEKIKEVVIEEGVTSIGFCAFYKMPNLETVVLPSTISEFKGIGYNSRTIAPNMNPGGVTTYASFAFAECTKLNNLTLTEGMKAIGGYAFYDCTSLESVRIPTTIKDEIAALDSINWWGVYSFAKCSSLKNITLPEGLTIMGAYAFSETAVESVVIPSTIEAWDMADVDEYNDQFNSAFANCKKLSSVTFTDGIKTIGESAFWGCTSLKKVAIPKSVTYMYNSFAYCDGLEEVYIEEGTQISAYSNGSNSYFDSAFDYCTNLKRIEIPEGVYLGSNFSCFEKCNSLEEVYIHSKSTKAYKIPVNSKIKFYVYNDSQAYEDLSKDTSTFNKIYDISEAISNAHSALNKAVNEAKAYTEDKYTAESYGVLKTALENAKKYDENYTGVMAMQWAAEDISNAINSLVKKPAQDSVKPGTTKPSTTMPNVKSQAQKNAENAMKQAKITKLTAKSKAKKKITVTWKKVSKANGYQVQVSTNKKFKKNKIILTKTTSKKKITIKKLKSKKTYFVRVRAYATYKDSNGKPQKVYSSWIKKTRKVKVK